MTKVGIHYNSICLCCGKMDKEMVKIGPMVFCTTDFKSEFVLTGIYNEDSGEVDNNSKIYKKWIELYKNG